jgi:hypothetical protein
MSRPRVIDDLAKEVCRVIGRRRNSGGRDLKKFLSLAAQLMRNPAYQRNGLGRVVFKKGGKHRVDLIRHEILRAPWLQHEHRLRVSVCSASKQSLTKAMKRDLQRGN